MGIALLSPAGGRRQPRFYDLEILPDMSRGMVVLKLTHRGGRRLHLFAQPDDALDAAMQLVGAVIRIRGRGDAP